MTAPMIATPTQSATFLSILAACAPGTTVSVNLIHDDAHAAAHLPPASLGGLFAGACKGGYLFHVGYTKATDPAARGRVVLVYERTSKPIPATTQAVAS